MWRWIRKKSGLVVHRLDKVHNGVTWKISGGVES